MVLRLLRYKVNLQYVPGSQLHIADALSRDPDKKKTVDTTYIEDERLAVHSIIVATPNRLTQLQAATAKDVQLQKVIQYVNNGWPSHISAVPPAIKPFWKDRVELFVVDELVFKGNCLVIPESERPAILKVLHTAHQGVVSLKARARESLFWPGMAEDIENMVLNCFICQKYAKANIQMPLTPHEVPELPWKKVGIDFLKLDGDVFIVLVDYHSKFIEMQLLTSTTATVVCQFLKTTFARHGIPQIVMSDNGPPFDSYLVKAFMDDWGITHNTSSPKYSPSNGMIERAIQTLEGLLKKAKQAGVDPYLALLEYRATPKPDLPSPAEMLMGRRIRTLQPTNKLLLEPKFPMADTRQKLQRKQDLQKKYADVKRKDLEPLTLGQNVLYTTGPRKWDVGIVSAIGPDPNSYWIKTPKNAIYRRNRVHLRPLRTSSNVANHNEPSHVEISSDNTATTLVPIPTTVSTSESQITMDTSPRVETDDANKTPSSPKGSQQSTPRSGMRKKMTRCGRTITTPLRFKD